MAPTALRAAVGIREHEHGYRVLALDPAFDRDAFAMAIACQEGGGETVSLEQVQALDPPVSLRAALDGVERLVGKLDPTKR